MGEPTIDSPEGHGEPGPVIRDRRRLDPETGQLRDAYDVGGPAGPVGAPAPAGQHGTDHSEGAHASGQDAGAPAGAGSPASAGGSGDGAASANGSAPGGGAAPAGPTDQGRADQADGATLDGILADLDAAQASAAERLSDLQRLQAEFVNYRRRVDRDRDVSRDQAVAGVLEALLPVLDDIHLARQHGDLDGGPFAAIAEKLDSVLQRLGLARYGEAGEEFDPAVHEALMRTEAELGEGVTTTTVVQVLQPGYRAGDRVLRAARVAVADPQ